MIGHRRLLVTFGLCLCLVRVAAADEPRNGAKPPPVPVTRDDMKKALDDSKHSTPRLPLPPLTEEQKARAAEAAKGGEAGRAGLGGIINNGRMRQYYLSDYSLGGFGNAGGRPQGADRPAGANRGAGANREGGPGSPNYPFQTQLFWIVSRGNNCTYCMGHQETKLAATGLTDDQIAALDGDWSEFDDAKRAAFAFTKKLTYEPHAIRDADIAALRKHYDDAQITDMIVAVAGFNAMNRWTGALRIPQEERDYLKPTSPKYASVLSHVAPVPADAKGSGFVAPAPRKRPELESRSAVETALEAARKRTPRLKVADESATKAALNDAAGDAPPQWMRLLATLPKSAPGRVASQVSAETKGKLDARTKAIIYWVAARNDRAWYALGHARKRLQALGFSDDRIFSLDKPESLDSPADREVAGFAAKLTVDPAQINDDDILRLRKLFDDKKVAEIVFQVTQAASFDRITEAAGLRLED